VKVPYSSTTRTLGYNREVMQTFEYMRQNIRAVVVKLEETSYQLGRVLSFDPARERFVGDGARQADALLTRNYRKPYVVPQKV